MKDKPSQWNPVDYAHNSSVQLAWAQELSGKLALKGDERLLDIGCGDGKISSTKVELLYSSKTIFKRDQNQ
ncbi:MAG: hypothetical protein HYR94_30020 [Chloroflexi bacterium]|nr:hypothetical protein [Chloroflexota bacterium]